MRPRIRPSHLSVRRVFPHCSSWCPQRRVFSRLGRDKKMFLKFIQFYLINSSKFLLTLFILYQCQIGVSQQLRVESREHTRVATSWSQTHIRLYISVFVLTFIDIKHSPALFKPLTNHINFLSPHPTQILTSTFKSCLKPQTGLWICGDQWSSPTWLVEWGFWDSM